MLSEQDFILSPPVVKVRLALAPAYNVLNSLLLLNFVEERSGLGEWVYQTFNGLSEAEKNANKHIGTFFAVIQPPPEMPGFLDYIAYLDGLDAADLATRYVTHLSDSSAQAPMPEEIMANRDSFMECITLLHSERYGEKTLSAFDADYYSGIYDLLREPEQLKATLIAHLRHMWEAYCGQEWQETLPLLEEALASFEQVDLNDLTALEAVRAITGRDMTSLWDRSDEAEEYVFVPSPHMGPYLSNFGDHQMTYIVFGARTPEGVRPRSQALSRADLLVQLSALADETRLSILDLLTRYKELCAQDIISMLNLSQSSASRHLRQLTASGYLIERRRDVNKCYSLNRGRIQETTLALSVLLGTAGR